MSHGMEFGEKVSFTFMGLQAVVCMKHCSIPQNKLFPSHTELQQF